METWRNELYHHGILGMKWGVRRYQNPDGSLTAAGKKRYATQKNAALFAEKRARGDRKRANSFVRQAKDSENWERKYLGENGVKNYVEELLKKGNPEDYSDEMEHYGVNSMEALAKAIINEDKRIINSKRDYKTADRLVKQGEKWAQKATEIRNKKIDEISKEEIKQYEKMVKNLRLFKYFPADSAYWTDSPDLYEPKKKKG